MVPLLMSHPVLVQQIFLLQNLVYNILPPGVILPARPGLPLRGVEIELMLLLAEKFRFKPVFEQAAPDFYIRQNNSFNYGGTTSQASPYYLK